MAKREQHLVKKDKKIKSLQDEIERRQFIEAKVQKYVKGLIGQNQRFLGFLEQLKSDACSVTDMRRQIEDFQRIIETNEGGEENDGGESTENEEEEDDGGSIEQNHQGKNISVEINDL